MTDPMKQTDPLTGLLSRRRIIEILEGELERRKTSPNPLSVVLYDINKVKIVNDEYGLDAVDEVLRQLGRLLAATVHPGKYVGRFGGDEFLVVAPDTDSQNAVQVAEQIGLAVEQTEFSYNGSEIKITVKYGIAVAEGDAHPTLMQMVQAADEVMYKSWGLKDNHDLFEEKPLVAVVYDEPDCRLLLRRSLEQLGCAVAEFESGEVFLANASKNTACVLLHETLPGLQGHETFQHMRRTGRCTPVISECHVHSYKQMLELYGHGQVAHVQLSRRHGEMLGLGTYLEGAIRKGLLATGHCLPPRMRLFFGPTLLSWNGGTIPRLAQTIAAERSFQDLPILADALEESGFPGAAILTHCRHPGKHFRRCWVVDLLSDQA